MKRLHPGFLATILSLSAMGCSPTVPGSFTLKPEMSVSQIHNFGFRIQSGFQIAASSGEQAQLETTRQTFEADLRSGNLESYRQAKHFSIQLLAGSEGNYFVSPDILQALTQKVLATLVVVLPNDQFSVFKGEFENQRFYFADPAQQLSLDTSTKAYLLTANADFTIQTTLGEILPQAADNSTPVVEASPSAMPVQTEPLAQPASEQSAAEFSESDEHHEDESESDEHHEDDFDFDSESFEYSRFNPEYRMNPAFGPAPVRMEFKPGFNSRVGVPLPPYLSRAQQRPVNLQYAQAPMFMFDRNGEKIAVRVGDRENFQKPFPAQAPRIRVERAPATRWNETHLLPGSRP
ncbi:hypothetical protein COW36_04795 [bacterium (Candidatus Blackallbacteria) CG17_big_fil_post_rev_8_21_14_2_50_48_46]|uniref:Uncharacterized protein n=1 Tax=bacterium (Candidatus Blackallbacteria) CG17_big_fil_post_rev_8_21_14_2_50_48_46 TaxID=2014261 RepID=A0A2M7G941_9BACT|nr:MAG: hypothetical protein COW64_04150 [bacterium (Candidatus Blackallbacteria) CG18_big_fil_WC_8_21_14_2_50_49_26]PIW18613.1 MAG: hypothetical protein COW36_04795 [bacterium (Candidatus Blackallbacteria) CG17_big_fil_post_rev_8_21_14_2_50_48_46]PIW46401.1 MAG: hypothetical protein COW20_15885 [bacterium (Candidatus Blackallbacteria) CG13_big_fil_rev_8_21_14_2_50_49_14]